MDAVEELNKRPKHLLSSGNENLRRDNIYSWTLPAWAVRLPDGRTFNACPSAGICAKVCYARNGSYRFSNVRLRHQRNLAYTLDDLPGWTEQMIGEIRRKRTPPVVRIHDAGDYYSDEYTGAWLEVIRACPDARFYSYTKELDRMRRLVEPNRPVNFKWVYSYGGVQDHLVDPDKERVCDVFPTVEGLHAAGYHDQAASDLLAVDGPTPVGMGANNIPHFRKLQAGRTFRGWQAEAAAELTVHRERRAVNASIAAILSGNRR
jgi:hypothetical protein